MMSRTQTNAAHDGMDVLWGAEEIAREIRRTVRQTNHMLATKSLPGAKKIGGRWCITKQALRAVFNSTKDGVPA